MSNSEVGRKFTFWVVYDATGDQQFVKMDSDTGCLVMFDNEESAATFTSGLVGVDYREVVLYSCSQPEPDVAQLVEALARCRHQASYSIGEEDALRIQLGKVRDIVNETLSALPTAKETSHDNQ